MTTININFYAIAAERGTAGAQTGRWTHPLHTPTDTTALPLPRKKFLKKFSENLLTSP